MKYNIENEIVEEKIIQSAHQPNFIPWIGYFAKINQSHVFTYSDDVMFRKQQSVSRSSFVSPQSEGYEWVVPIKRSTDERISDKVISFQDIRIFERGLQRIKNDYKKTRYNSDLFEILFQIEEKIKKHQKLAAFNIDCISMLSNLFELKRLEFLGSDLGLDKYSSNERLVKRAKILNTNKYLCGQGAKGYQDDNYLTDNGIEVLYVNYSEIYNEFGEGHQYSVLHLIAHHGIDKIKRHFANSKYKSRGAAYLV